MHACMHAGVHVPDGAGFGRHQALRVLLWRRPVPGAQRARKASHVECELVLGLFGGGGAWHRGAAALASLTGSRLDVCTDSLAAHHTAFRWCSCALRDAPTPDLVVRCWRHRVARACRALVTCRRLATSTHHPAALSRNPRKWRSSFFNAFYFVINIGSLVSAGQGVGPMSATAPQTACK
jgi:hypothetical protein